MILFLGIIITIIFIYMIYKTLKERKNDNK